MSRHAGAQRHTARSRPRSTRPGVRRFLSQADRSAEHCDGDVERCSGSRCEERIGRSTSLCKARYRPGFEKHLSGASVLLVYAASHGFASLDLRPRRRVLARSARGRGFNLR